MQNPYERYKSVKVETASPKGLVIIAYDGMIDCLQKAKRAIEKQPKDIEKSTKEIIRAEQILGVLIDGLNPNVGEVAQMLGSFYSFLGKQLIQLNFSKEPEGFDKVINLIKQVKEFWQQNLKDTKESEKDLNED